MNDWTLEEIAEAVAYDNFDPDTITAEKLREILFYINDQNMTVAELRKRLFSIDDQKAVLIPGLGMWNRMGVEM